MKNITHFFLFSFLLLGTFTSYAQSDLQIFGFYQVRVQSNNGETNLTANVNSKEIPYYTAESDLISPAVQQLNLFFRKELLPNLTSMVNIQFTNNFNSSLNWGNLNIEEAWFNYGFNEAVNIKAGILIPRFNYINEIKNKLPLLPYITRPLVYESSLSSTFNADAFVPSRAFFQVYGEIPVSEASIDYSAFVGPSENSYVVGEGNISGGKERGVDTTSFKLFGGRLGFKYEDFRIGVSSTYDKQNEQATLGEDVPRVRLGADLGFKYSIFSVEAELIKVLLDPENTDQDMDKFFTTTTLETNYTDNIFSALSYSLIKDKQVSYLASGMHGVAAVVGYRITDAFVIKGEYARSWTKDDFTTALSPQLPKVNAHADIHYDNWSIAASIVF